MKLVTSLSLRKAFERSADASLSLRAHRDVQALEMQKMIGFLAENFPALELGYAIGVGL